MKEKTKAKEVKMKSGEQQKNCPNKDFSKGTILKKLKQNEEERRKVEEQYNLLKMNMQQLEARFQQLVGANEVLRNIIGEENGG